MAGGESAQVLGEERLEEAIREVDSATAEYRARMDRALKAVKDGPPRRRGMESFTGQWKGLGKEYSHDPVETGVSLDVLDRIADAIGTFPEGFTPHERLAPHLARRRDAIRNRKPLDWGTGETLAYGSLVLEGTPVRLSGQDTRRGTFTHRHAVVVDFNTGQPPTSFCELMILPVRVRTCSTSRVSAPLSCSHDTTTTSPSRCT